MEDLPELDSVDERWAQWYRDLERYRPQSGFGISPIPLQEVVAYCDLLGYEDRLFFVTVIGEIDRRVLEESRQKAQRESKR